MLGVVPNKQTNKQQIVVNTINLEHQLPIKNNRPYINPFGSTQSKIIPVVPYYFIKRT